jgi:uncharacterized repeat protein (TIGR03803 family)
MDRIKLEATPNLLKQEQAALQSDPCRLLHRRNIFPQPGPWEPERRRRGTSALTWRRAICAVWMLSLTMGAPLLAQTLTTLVSFDLSDGAFPVASLVQGTDGNLYGTTTEGGTATPAGGTVFKITPSGTLTTLYSFCARTNCADGDGPAAGLVLGTDGNFYGTTNGGGDGSCGEPDGCGAVFKITPSGTLTTLHSFCTQTNCPDGWFPKGALIEGSNGDFYGTTYFGGATNAYAGTIFKITSRGTLTTIYSFCSLSNCADGSTPVGGLVRGTDGDLYGTTASGGAFGYGSVFKLSPGGVLTTLHSFDFTDGEDPTAALVQANNGKFYGSTFYGSIVFHDCGLGCGTVFAVNSRGALSTLDSFDWSNGYGPYSAMIQATDGNLYGTTANGIGSGTIFKMTPQGELTVIYSFYGGPSGDFPYGGLLQATSGTFYGTTEGDGIVSNGTVFSLDASLGPFIAFVQPSGEIGQAAQIIGQGLTGSTAVTFSGVPATSFSVVSDTYMTATVPSGATTGSVVVTTPTGKLTSNVNFNVTK